MFWMRLLAAARLRFGQGGEGRHRARRAGTWSMRVGALAATAST
jgi:hypothetical protein